mmetsp:Transcript_25555/g.40358  ORF Transcript_25555/g.40358 Transcript_25555/m.40358 type:complete len:171 (+) Transcript_25555:1187-1699(+)
MATKIRTGNTTAASKATKALHLAIKATKALQLAIKATKTLLLATKAIKVILATKVTQTKVDTPVRPDKGRHTKVHTKGHIRANVHPRIALSPKEIRTHLLSASPSTRVLVRHATIILAVAGAHTRHRKRRVGFLGPLEARECFAEVPRATRASLLARTRRVTSRGPRGAR